MLPFQDTKLSPKERAHDLCARLTSREKTGQLNQRLYGFQSVRREGDRLTLVGPEPGKRPVRTERRPRL